MSLTNAADRATVTPPLDRPLTRYRKKPLVIHAVQMETDFECVTIDGNIARGKAGDYLVRDLKGYYYPCNREVFEGSYDLAVD